MDLNKARMIFDELDNLNLKEASLKRLKQDMIEQAVIYSRLRVDYLLTPIAQRQEIDARRIRSHDAFIGCCNSLSRNMKKGGYNADWREKLGEERKEIGDFACFIHCWLGIKAR